MCPRTCPRICLRSCPHNRPPSCPDGCLYVCLLGCPNVCPNVCPHGYPHVCPTVDISVCEPWEIFCRESYDFFLPLHSFFKTALNDKVIESESKEIKEWEKRKRYWLMHRGKFLIFFYLFFSRVLRDSISRYVGLSVGRSVGWWSFCSLLSFW